MVDSGLAVDRVHGRVLWQVRNSGYWVVGAGSWVAEQGVDGLRGGVGEGRPDAGLDLLGAVEDLDVQGGEQVLDQGGRGAGEGRAQVGQFVEQGGVLAGGGGGVEGVELGLGGGALVVVFAVAGADPGPVGLGGGAGVGAELFQFGEQPGLGDLDPGQLGGEPGVLAGAGGGVLGGGGGDQGGEHGRAVIPEDVLVQERGDGGHDGVFPDGHRGDGVAGAGRGVAGVGSLVRAGVVDVLRGAGAIGAADPAHAALACGVPDPGPQGVPAAGIGGGFSGSRTLPRSAPIVWAVRQASRLVSGVCLGSGDQIH